MYRILIERIIILPNFICVPAHGNRHRTKAVQQTHFNLNFTKQYSLYKHISASASCQNSKCKNIIRDWTCSSPGGDKKCTYNFGGKTLSKVATWNIKSVGEGEKKD
jgi:hypothetical protein